MKVLLIIKGEPDYQSDAVMHGLYSLLGDNLTHTSEYKLMYKTLTTPEELLATSGRGFTMWGNLPEYLNDNSDIPKKIENRYYDYIVYGSVRRCIDYYDIVNLYYPKDRIILIDGEDDTHIVQGTGNHMFKRELIEHHDNVFPISFAIPEEKIVKSVSLKTKLIADYKPSSPGSGYVFNSEEEYYKNYQTATYALTHKKSGWDCMRHYEILANGCIPYFTDLKDCPGLTMTNFPKELILRSNELFDVNTDEHFEITNKLLEHTKTHHRTIDLAKYIIDTVKNI
jgi:hypothetical protein